MKAYLYRLYGYEFGYIPDLKINYCCDTSNFFVKVGTIVNTVLDEKNIIDLSLTFIQKLQRVVDLESQLLDAKNDLINYN